MSMQNNKYSILVDVEGNEELNRAIDALIEARVLSAVRKTCDSVIDKIIEAEVSRSVTSKLNSLSSVHGYIHNAVMTYLNLSRDALKEGVEAYFDKYPESVSRGIAQAVKGELFKEVPATVINAIVKALTSEEAFQENN